MPTLRTQRGLDWNYQVSGQGESIVMIHGLGASGHIWQAQKDFLDTDFQVLTIDLPGHGRSGWMPLSVNEIAADIREILNYLEIAPFSMVASSMGGLVAWELFRLMPHEVMRISMVGSIPKFTRSPDYPAGLDLEKIHTLSRQFDGDYAAMLDIFFRSLFTMKERQNPSFKQVKDLREQEPLPKREALKHYLELLEKTDLRDRLASIICPLQFVTGSEDYICPRSVMDWVAEHAYNARFDFMEGCGHLPFLVETKEYNRLLEDFLLN
ncbi:MAG: alpha/beta hydrolase [Candidatus Omnitrophica bacterium]|nr:alpha/beta hydrolase [Candidatus Omnitrophota bacterium]MDE2222166.1 alpha/beta hydrolase [Candidatus Omnitrophota bacterium]